MYDSSDVWEGGLDGSDEAAIKAAQTTMTTKNIQDVVAEILLLAQKGVRKVKNDDMTFKQFNEALRHHLTQLVKEVEAGEKRPDEPTRWVSEPMTQKEAEIYVQGMYDLMMMVGCDGHCKHYDPLFFDGDTAYSYVLELDDGGRRHSYVTPQWVALKALLEFAQTLKDEWDIGGWNEYFANNTREAIKEIEALTPPTSDEALQDNK